MSWQYVTDVPGGAKGEWTPCVGYNGKLYVQDNYGTFNAYDPVTNTWAALTPPSAYVGAYGMMFAIGSRLYLFDWRTEYVQIYDPSTDTWSAGTPLGISGRNCQFAYDGTKVYCFYIGSSSTAYPGVTYSNNGWTNVFVYDPATDTWDDGQQIPVPINPEGWGWGSAYCVSSPDGHNLLVYVNGWWDQNQPVGETTVLDLANIAAGWTPGASEPIPREDQAFGYSDTSLHIVAVVGGDDNNVNAMTSCQAYDPVNDIWDDLPDLPVDLDYPATAILNGYMYCVGGYRESAPNGDTSGIYRMPLTDLPSPLPPPPPAPPDLQLQVDPQPPAAIDTPGYIYVTINNATPNSRIGFHLDDPSGPEIDYVYSDDYGDVFMHSVLMQTLTNGTHLLYAFASSPDPAPVASATPVVVAQYYWTDNNGDTFSAEVYMVALDGSDVTVPQVANGPSATTQLYDDSQNVVTSTGLAAADPPLGETTDGSSFTVIPAAPTNAYIVAYAVLDELVVNPPGSIAHASWLQMPDFSVSDTFDVANGATPMPPPPVVIQPTLIPRQGVQRWYFQDPTGNHPDHYIFPRNPNPDGVGNPFADKNVQYMTTTGIQGQAIAFEGYAKPQEWPVTGLLYSKAQEEQLRYWYNLPYRIYLIDHENRAWTVMFTSLQITYKPSQNYPEKRQYQAKFAIFAGPVNLT